MLKENLHLSYPPPLSTLLAIHCLKVLEENIDLSNHTYLNTFKETVNMIFQHCL